MGKLIKEDTGARGVNFQKASCTLDASVKIYSHRVDDTYASSHRILESLSRNGVGEDDNGTAERAAARVGTKSASNRLNIAETIERNPENLNSASVESEHATDPMFHKMSKAFDEGGAKGMLMNNLRVSPDSCALVFTSEGLASAVGGAPNGEGSTSSLGPSSSSSSSMVDISHLVFKCGFSLPDLAGLTLCPTLAEYRKTLGIAEDLTGSIDTDVCSGTVDAAALFGGSSLWGVSAASASYAPSSSSSSSSSSADFLQGSAASEAMPYAHDNGDDDDDNYGGGGLGCGDYDDGNVDEQDDCDDEGNYIASNRRASMAAGGPGMVGAGALGGGRKSMGGDGGGLGGAGDGFGANAAPGQQGKIRWDESVLNGDGDQNQYQQKQSQNQNQPLEWEGMGIPGSALTQASEYAFFDLEALMKSNSWAGARHWRYATRRREAATVVATAEEGGAAAGAVDSAAGAEAVAGKAGKTAAKGGKKAAEAAALAFNGEAVVAESAFAVSAKSRGDTTLMTAAAVEKDAIKAQQGELFLPMDSKIEAKDLCRLFLCQPMIVPPAMLYHMLVPKAGAAPSSSGAGSGGDMFWGQVKAIPATPKPIGSGYNDYDDVDDDDEGYGYGGGGAANYGDDDCDNQRPQTAGADAAAEPQYQVPEGLGLNSDRLLQAGRMVEKVDIGYATVAKKVNVRKLKGDLWGLINTQVNGVVPGVDDGGENTENAENIAGYSFAKGKDKKSQGLGQGQGQEEQSKVLSFQEVVNSIAQKQEQGDVSLPFYFICLLHLANEKVSHSSVLPPPASPSTSLPLSLPLSDSESAK